LAGNHAGTPMKPKDFLKNNGKNMSNTTVNGHCHCGHTDPIQKHINL